MTVPLIVYPDADPGGDAIFAGPLGQRLERIGRFVLHHGAPADEAEFAARIEGAEAVIRDHRPLMLVATHGADTHRFVVEFLTRHDYAFEILDPGSAAGDIEIMAVPR